MKMTTILCCIVFLFVSMLSAVARQQEKPRVIVTTDGEIDDQSSMIRFLMYSSDYDVAGIVQVNGVQKDGHSKDKWIESQIAKYAECLRITHTGSQYDIFSLTGLLFIKYHALQYKMTEMISTYES